MFDCYQVIKIVQHFCPGVSHVVFVERAQRPAAIVFYLDLGVLDRSFGAVLLCREQW